tara:strand:+ start:28 stop:276 length:249 start_codon:yes stop_codon:yes gene_type:complete
MNEVFKTEYDYADYNSSDTILENVVVYGYWSGCKIEYVVCKILKETETTLDVWSEVCGKVFVRKTDCLKFGNNCYLDLYQRS